MGAPGVAGEGKRTMLRFSTPFGSSRRRLIVLLKRAVDVELHVNYAAPGTRYVERHSLPIRACCCALLLVAARVTCCTFPGWYAVGGVDEIPADSTVKE